MRSIPQRRARCGITSARCSTNSACSQERFFVDVFAWACLTPLHSVETPKFREGLFRTQTPQEMRAAVLALQQGVEVRNRLAGPSLTLPTTLVRLFFCSGAKLLPRRPTAMLAVQQASGPRTPPLRMLLWVTFLRNKGRQCFGPFASLGRLYVVYGT